LQSFAQGYDSSGTHNTPQEAAVGNVYTGYDTLHITGKPQINIEHWERKLLTSS